MDKKLNRMNLPQIVHWQEMFIMLYNALKVIGRLSGENSAGIYATTLSDFSDADEIAPWAIDAMKLLIETGQVVGSGDKLFPRAATNRAQMARILYSLLNGVRLE